MGSSWPCDTLAGISSKLKNSEKEGTDMSSNIYKRWQFAIFTTLGNCCKVLQVIPKSVA